MKPIFFLLSSSLLFCLLTACTQQDPLPPGVLYGETVQEQQNTEWTSCRFQFDWPEERDPEGGLDVLVAHQVVEPILLQFQDKILLWRFHRRAGRDATGHQLSFLYYSKNSDRTVISEAILTHPLAEQLKTAGILQQHSCTSSTPTNPSNISATSDPVWNTDLQREWPYFIMGTSATWLGLIHDFAGPISTNKKRSISELRAHYSNVDQEITKLWEEEGAHAFLHHLNAIFGYEPVKVRGKKMTF